MRLENTVLCGRDVRVEAASSGNAFGERWPARDGVTWVEIATTADPIVLVACGGERLDVVARRLALFGGRLEQELETPLGRVRRQLAILGEGPWCEAVTRFEPTAAVQLRSFGDVYQFSDGCDWACSPSVGESTPTPSTRRR